MEYINKKYINKKSLAGWVVVEEDKYHVTLAQASNLKGQMTIPISLLKSDYVAV